MAVFTPTLPPACYGFRPTSLILQPVTLCLEWDRPQGTFAAQLQGLPPWEGTARGSWVRSRAGESG